MDLLQDHASQKQVVGSKVDAKSDFIELLDGHEPISNPNNDKFNLANQILDEEVNIAMGGSWQWW